MKDALPTYSLHPELKAAIDGVNSVLSRRALLDSAVNEMPKTIASLESEAARVTDDLAKAEANLALSNGAEAQKLEKLEKQCKALVGTIGEAEFALKRAKNRAAALEQMAPEIDAAVVNAKAALNAEVGVLARDLRTRLSTELREATQPILQLIGKIKAANFGQFNDFLACAFLPDPEDFMFLGGSETFNEYRGVNLLLANALEDQSLEIAATLGPVKMAIAAVNAYRPYVPLAKRPVPYQIKGSAEGDSGRPGFSRPPANSQKALAERPSGEGHSKGMPQELNSGAASLASLDLPKEFTEDPTRYTAPLQQE